MQTKTDRLISDLQMKRSVRKEIREAKKLVLVEQGDLTFGEAFSNVLKALKLFAMDVSNSLRLAINALFTFDPEKLEQSVEQFNDRRQRINQEWKPILDSVEKSIDAVDPIMKMAILGPDMFWTLKGAGAALIAGKTVAEIVRAENWETIVNPYTETLNTDQNLVRSYRDFVKTSEKQAAQASETNTLLSRLASIFSERVSDSENVLIEQVSKVDPKDKKLKMSEKEAVKMFVQITGMDKSFAKLKNEYVAGLRKLIEEVTLQIEPAKSTSQLFAAKNLEEFKKAFESARQRNPKIDPQTYEKMKKTVEEQSQKLIQDPQSLQKMSKDAGRPLNPSEQKDVAENFVFRKAKEKFDSETASALKNVVIYAKKAIDDMKIDDSTLNAMKDSPYEDVNEISKIYENMLMIYKEIKNDFETKAKSKVK